jgi:hypothetical protein
MLDIQTALINLKKSYKKNIAEFRAIINKQYPDFIYDSKLKTIKDEIPVFTFHSVEPIRFENQLRFLAKNNYQTLDADEVYDCLIGRKTIPERAICITFDDGWGSVWAVAYPLLKRYQFKAVCFLVPGLISQSTKRYPNLDDVNAGSVTFSEIAVRETSNEPFCTWEEIKKMHEDGIIDFQSHGMYHTLIFTSPEIVDFINPFYDFYKQNFNVPIIRFGGEDRISRAVEWGTPIYNFESRFSGMNRYFDDPDLRNICTEYVATNGGITFFKKRKWRSEMKAVVKNYKKSNKEKARFEGKGELEKSILEDQIQSKNAIEKKLPEKVVRHFCYPWWVGSSIARQLSIKVGYVSNFLGVVPERKTRNRFRDDPFRIGRLLSDEYIFRLPGDGCKSFWSVINCKIRTNMKALSTKYLSKKSVDNLIQN